MKNGKGYFASLSSWQDNCLALRIALLHYFNISFPKKKIIMGVPATSMFLLKYFVK